MCENDGVDDFVVNVGIGICEEVLGDVGIDDVEEGAGDVRRERRVFDGFEGCDCGEGDV